MNQADHQIRLLIDALPTMAWSLQPDGTLDFVNKRWLEYTGFSQPQAITDSKRIVHPDDLRAAVEHWDPAMSAGDPYEHEIRLRGANGKYHWFLIRVSPLRDAKGRVVKWFGVAIDIEHRKQAELETRRLIDAIPQQIWSGLADGAIDYCNQRWRSYIGLDEDQECRDGWQAMLHPDDRTRVLEAWREAVTTGTPYEQEERHRGADGHYRWFLARGVPLRDASGEIVRWYGTNTDIEDLKRAQQALLAQGRRYRALMATSTDAIYVLDQKGNLREANPAFLWRRGFSKREVKRLNVSDWDAQWDREQLRRRLGQIIGRSAVFETRHRCKDGSIFDVQVCATGVRIDAEELIFCVTREITERKQAEAALAARARQQAVVAELGKLALTGVEPQALFDRATAMVAETLGVEYCKVLQLLPDDSGLKLVAGVGWKEGLVGQATVGAGLDSQAGYTLLTKDLVFVEDLRTEERFNGPPLLHEHGVVSGLSVIISGIEKPFGVMGAHTAHQRTFTIDDAHFFQSIANVLAEAIHRKHAEKAMQESERKYRELVELSHDLVWAVDMEGRITFMSPSSRHIYGREPEEMIGHFFTEFMTPDQAGRSMSDLARMIETGDSVIELETRLLHRDGHEIVLSANGMVLRDAAGNIVGTTGTSRDITERKLAEDALRESEQRFRELAENIHEVFWMSDRENTQMLYVSPAYETIWGRSRETLYSSPASWMDAIHADDKERMIRTRANRDSAFPHENTYRIVRPDGSVRWIRDRGFPVRDEGGAVVRFAGIAEDITLAKQTEQEQERALSLMVATLESTADGILVVSAEGKIEAFNRLFARMWRLPDRVLASKEDALAVECVREQLVEPEKFFQKVTYLYQHPEEESFDQLEFKDGRVFERYSRPQFVGGEVAGRVWSFRDATERRNAAEELERANNQLRILSRQLFRIQEEERRHLARELHDEIGQVLTAAKLNLDLIAPDVAGHSAGRLDDSIGLINRLLTQVRQLSLDLHPPLLEELGLVPTLRWLVDQQAQRTEVDLSFRANVAGLKLVREVETNCFRVAQEAVTNAIRHANAKNVTVQLKKKDERLWLVVRDDGTGFDPAIVQSKDAGRSSLGLVSMKERASLVRGGLEIRSTSGKGTEIRAWFPLPARQANLPKVKA